MCEKSVACPWTYRLVNGVWIPLKFQYHKILSFLITYKFLSKIVNNILSQFSSQTIISGKKKRREMACCMILPVTHFFFSLSFSLSLFFSHVADFNFFPFLFFFRKKKSECREKKDKKEISLGSTIIWFEEVINVKFSPSNWLLYMGYW